MLRRLPAVSLSILLSLPVAAATRMTFDIHGAATPIAWVGSAFPLHYDIDSRVTRLNANAASMVDRAFAAWSSLPDADIRFQSEGVVANAVTQGEGISVTIADDLLSGQGAMALTVYTYDTTNGHMLDADIRVDPTLFDGSVNAQAALEHEVGHTLGLDHSPVLSSVMYPYVGPESSPVDLDVDDIISISTIYPKSDPTLRGATMTGRVMGDNGGIFAAQVVVVNELGQLVASSLTNAAGEFTLMAIPEGRYRLYAEPLDGPVLVGTMQGTWREANLKPFPTEFYGSTVDVRAGQVYGNLVVNTAGPVQLNPRTIGASEANVNQVSLSSMPVFVRPGQTVRLTVGGDGFISGMTQFEILDPSFRRTSDFEWWDGSVSATYTVDANAPSASSVILVRTGNESATLTGALKVYRGKRVRSIHT
jgi:hypothetical protein